MTFAARPALSSRCFGLVGSLAIHIALGIALFVAFRGGEAGRVTRREGHSPLIVEMLPGAAKDAKPGKGRSAGAPSGDERPQHGIRAGGGPGRAAQAPKAEAGARGNALAAPAGHQAPTHPGDDAQPSQAAASGSDADTFRARLLRHIERFRGYPPEARRGAVTGTTRVHFVMDHAGGVDQIWIETSSGSRLLDDAALAAVMRARPLPPPPEDWPATVSVSLPIEFALDG